MAKPMVHAESSAKKFGGKAQDYLDIHELIDSSREAFPDLRHRALTHNSWFITKMVPKVFGETRKNSAGSTYSVREVAERHVFEDFHQKFMPSAQDYLEQIEFQDWMDNGGDEFAEPPPSWRKLKKFQDAKEGGEPSGIRRLFSRKPKTEEYSGGRCGPPGTFD